MKQDTPPDPATEALDEEIASLNASRIDEARPAAGRPRRPPYATGCSLVRATLVHKVRPRKPRVVLRA